MTHSDDPIIDVFVAYARPNRALAGMLVEHLRGRCRVFWDRMMGPGERWNVVLPRAISHSRVLAVLVSNNTPGAWYEQDEVALAVDLVRQAERHRRVIPVILSDDARPPYGLNGVVAVRLSEAGSMNGVASQLARALDELAPWPGSTPSPRYANADSQALGEELSQLKRERAAAMTAGEPTGEFDARIRDIKRQLRAGPRLTAGDRLGPDHAIQLLEPLGTGGFATVWKAYDETRDQEVAVKVLHGQWSHDKTRRDRFFRGSRQMAKLQHPHVVGVLQTKGADEGHHYFVMDFLPGGDLRHSVTEGRLTREQARDAILHIGDALQHAHDRGLIHRDVKPHNILLAADGTPKLTDFDLVRAADTTGGTRTGALGAFLYAAPELMQDASQADHRADVYGLGMTAVFALCGRDLDMGAVRMPERVIQGIECSRALQEVLERAVAWDVDERYGSVAEFCADLAAAPLVEPSLPEPPPPDPPAPEPTAPDEEERAPKRGGADHHRLQEIHNILRGDGARQARARTLEDLAKRDPDPQLRQLVGAALLALGGQDHLLDTLRQDAGGAVALGIPSPAWAEIPAGEFRMGSPAGEDGRFDDEGPQHDVRIWRPFQMLATPVTQALYAVVTGANPSHFAGDLRRPVEQVSWNEARAFCEAWTTLRGDAVRLPTEAEWEYACRAGTTTRFWRGDGDRDLDAVGWFTGNARGETQPAGEKPANDWGLHDVHGNVWEWCEDDGHGSYESAPGDSRAWVESPRGDARVVRGGSFRDDARFCRSAYRNSWHPTLRWLNQGFRVVLPAPSGSGL